MSAVLVPIMALLEPDGSEAAGDGEDLGGDLGTQPFYYSSSTSFLYTKNPKGSEDIH